VKEGMKDETRREKGGRGIDREEGRIEEIESEIRKVD